jgi:CheY-like chemotaxis protein
MMTNGSRSSSGPVEDVKVLFVEDDPTVAQMYRLKLELDGYQVVMAKDGEEGLELAARLKPDLIFLDIRLPKMGGLDVLEQLRRAIETRNTPVVILSNYGERELVERGLKLGALEYLIKSQTTPARLSSGVEGWLKE